jgi:hypothetical protein
MEKFNFKELNEVECKEKYRVEVWNGFAVSEDLAAEIKIYTIWETIWENIKISAKEILGYYELKKHKSWFEERCSKLLDQRKLTKLQWLQDPHVKGGDKLNTVRREASIHFRNKKRKYLKDKSNKLAMISKNKDIRDCIEE